MPPVTRRAGFLSPARSILALAALAGLVACGDEPTRPMASPDLAPSFSTTTTTQSFTSGSHVTTWDAIPETYVPSDWGGYYCTNTPRVGLNANWQNQHNAFVLTGHPWAGYYFAAPWINSWNHLGSFGGNSTSPHYNWTKYSTQVSGDGSFVIRLLADNCSWIYLDGTLVGVQGGDISKNSYGLTLSGTHTLEFIIFDGGGAAGGKFKLETTSNPPPPLNDDLDDDGVVNDEDAFPLDPTRWTLDSDGDGVNDDVDAFDNSDTSATIVIGTCNSGVTNHHFGNGTWSADLIGAAKSAARNHGQFMNAVSALTNEWKNAGLITGRQQGAIVSCAARSK